MKVRPEKSIGGYLGDFAFIHQMVMRQPYQMPANHFHEQYEIYYLLSGERYYFIKDRTYLVKKGDLVFVNKFELHKTFEAGSSGFERFLINFSDRLFQGFIDGSQTECQELLLSSYSRIGSGVIRIGINDQKFVEELFYKMIREVRGQRLGYAYYFRVLLMELLFFMSRCVDKIEMAPTDKSLTRKKMQTIVQYINKNYEAPLCLSSVSAMFDISPSYLSRSFKQVVGFSFVEYLNLLRIKESQKLLRETDKRVIDISEEVGFDNITHFGRVFKQVSGCAPNQYRKQQRFE